MCHLLFVLPFVSLILFSLLPFNQALLLYISVLLFCAIFYWLIWKDMRKPVSTGIEGMIEGIGRVIEIGGKSAKIFYKGEIWDATSADQLSVGDSVEIARVERMTVIVRKLVKGQARQVVGFGCH